VRVCVCVWCVCVLYVACVEVCAADEWPHRSFVVSCHEPDPWLMAKSTRFLEPDPRLTTTKLQPCVVFVYRELPTVNHQLTTFVYFPLIFYDFP
jgi:hypothetical protein